MKFIFILLLSLMSSASLLAQEKIYIEAKIETDKLGWINLLMTAIVTVVAIVEGMEVVAIKALENQYIDSIHYHDLIE